jgi:hypothetical protein
METHKNQLAHKHRWTKVAVVLQLSFVCTVLSIIGIVTFLIWSSVTATDKKSLSDADKNSYQAVFLNNGQAYFGKLQPAEDNEYLKLTDVWYLRTSETSDSGTANAQAPTSDSVNATIVKLGAEIHGPRDEMLISKNQVLFYENLKDDSKIVKAIKEDSR